MKDLKYDSQLNENIKDSKTPQFSISNLLKTLGLVMIGLLSSIIAFYCFVSIGVLYFLAVILPMLVGVTIFNLYNGVKGNKKKNIAKENLEVLTEQLKEEGLDINIKDLQNALVTETKTTTETIDRKEDVSVNEEIIRRFYMLDEQEQINVLQETIRSYEAPDGNYTEDRNLYLLEDEDKKDVEMPSIVKSLNFK